jgi:creatinine deaminase
VDYASVMPPFITEATQVDDASLAVLAHLPTPSLREVVAPAFFAKLQDADYMRLAVLLARKSDGEGGCPIGGVVVDRSTGLVVGKGHNTLVQEGHPYNHGETAAIRDAGRIDFSQTTMFTTLSPCDVCTALIVMRGFARVVVGNVTSASGNEDRLRQAGILVDVVEDPLGIEIYEDYRRRSPEQDLEDWRGLAAVRRRREGEG